MTPPSPRTRRANRTRTFTALAYDPDKHVLIFKVAVATGFDAPRAWTLVSVRPNRGRDFGLQIVGRIMRVHPSVRPIHGQDALLDSGYVLLTDPEMQAGLQAAVDELKAVRESIELITDNLDVLRVRQRREANRHGRTCSPSRPSRRSPPQTPDERQQRLSNLIDQGVVRPTCRTCPKRRQDRAIVAGETWRHQISDTPLFGDLPEALKPDTNKATEQAELPPLSPAAKIWTCPRR
jgi:type III restriction enzyme